MQQKEFEEKLKLQESEVGTTSENKVRAGSESNKEEVAEENPGELEFGGDGVGGSGDREKR